MITDFFRNIDLTLLILLSVLASGFLIQLFYYLIFFIRIGSFKKVSKKIEQEPVSIIICARNEAMNLKKFLPSVLSQTYPDYEVIVVNDCSEDETDDLLSSFKLEHSHLRTTTLHKDEKFTHGKKLALTVGIKAAKNEWLIMTDADCSPVNENWISTMQRNFSNKTEVVLGYGGYFPTKGLLNNLIRFDTFFIALQYLGSALAGWPYMGVGRNLAYKKSLFFKNKGFASHYKVKSGDDDLFINQTANKENTKVEINYQAHTRSESKSTWNSWFRQKKRHLTTWGYFRSRTNMFIGIEVFSRMIFYISFALLLIFFMDYLNYFIGIFAFRLILQLIIFKIAMNRLREKYLLLSSLFYDILLPLINFTLIFSNFFRRKNSTWS